MWYSNDTTACRQSEISHTWILHKHAGWSIRATMYRQREFLVKLIYFCFLLQSHFESMACILYLVPASTHPDRNCFCHLSPEEFKLLPDFIWKSSLNCCPLPRSRFWQSIYQYFKSRSLHATQINFDKIRFSQIMFTNSDPYPIFLPDLIESEADKFNRTFHCEKKPPIIQSYTDDNLSAFEIQIFCLTGRGSLSHICIGKFKTRPRGVKLSFWLTAVSIFNSICEPMNI